MLNTTGVCVCTYLTPNPWQCCQGDVLAITHNIAVFHCRVRTGMGGQDEEGQKGTKRRPHLQTTDYAVASMQHTSSSMCVALDAATLPVHTIWPTNLPITNTFLEQGSRRREQDS